MSEKLLKNPQQRFVVQCLAQFTPPSKVVTLVKEHFAIEITRQAVECYDPTKAAGAQLKQDLRELFHQTRATYIADTGAVGISHRVVRLETLNRLIEKAEEMRNLPLAAQLVKQAKEEASEIGPKPSNDNPGSGTPLTDTERIDRIAELLDPSRKS